MKFRWKPKHSVWEQKGEGYRIYGSGGWSWHCTYKHKPAKRTKTEKRTSLHKLLQGIKKKKGSVYVKNTRLNVIDSTTDDFENMALLHSPESDTEDKDFKSTFIKRPEIDKCDKTETSSFGYKNRNCKWSSKTRLKIINECPADVLNSLSNEKLEEKDGVDEKDAVGEKNIGNGKDIMNDKERPSSKEVSPSNSNKDIPLNQCTPSSDSNSLSILSTPKRADSCVPTTKNIELQETPFVKTLKSPEIVNGFESLDTSSTIQTPTSTVSSDTTVPDIKPALVPNVLSSNSINSSEEKYKSNESLSLSSSSPASTISGTPIANNTNKLNIIQGVRQSAGSPIQIPSLKTVEKSDSNTTETSTTPNENKPKVVKVSTKLPISAATDPQKLLQILNSGNNFSIMKALEAAGIKAPAGKLLAIRTSAGNFVLKAGEKNVQQAQSPTNTTNNVTSATTTPTSTPSTPISQTTPVAKPALSSNAAAAAFAKNLNLQKDFLSRAERRIKSMHHPYKTASSLLETESNRLSKQRVGVKSLFTLQKHPLRRLARGNFFKEARGFKYDVRTASNWPRSIPRPTFQMAWRYFVSKAEHFTTIAHMLRILHASIDWETVNDQPSKGVKRVITSNKGLFIINIYP